ncbi:MAG: SUMF1/EgtB/PvdO family nonheme iron enzyme [Aquimonas sp.]|nr:SUMF1/EgtB/PvdO family nonheme iron enzyme [Aquimonas sp.]
MSIRDIEGYRIEALFAEGPGWQLLKARRQHGDAPLLLLLPEAAGAQARVLLRAHASLRHSGIAAVLDIGETRQGGLYAALDASPGVGLAAAFRQGMDLDQACELIRRLLGAVAYLIQRGAPAPDLEPDSIVLNARGRPLLVRLVGPSSVSAQPRLIERLGRHFHEALTGIDPDPERWPPVLPDYLTRWQPLIDGCLGPQRLQSIAAVQAALDRLEGRASAVAAGAAHEPTPAPTLPAAAGASASATQAPQPAPAAAAGLRDSVAAEAGAAPVSAAAGSATRPSGLPRSADRDPAAEPLEGRAPVAPAARTPPINPDKDAAALPPHLRHTGPSRALPPEPGRIPSPAPAAPGGSPLRDWRRPWPFVLAGLGMVLLAGLVGYLRVAGDTADMLPLAASEPVSTAPAPAAQAAPVTRPTTFLDLMQAAEPDVVERTTLDVAELATVEDPLPAFILMARTNLEAGRLVEPPIRNALERFLQALSIEPGNREAQAGLLDTARRCLQADTGEDVSALLQRFACAERVAAAHPAALVVREDIARLRTAAIQTRLGPAREALAGWRSARAADLFDQVLALDPQLGEARAGADEARRQGQPGYSFRDPLGNGGRGPELRVAAGLAWARQETTVAEFSRYWQAAGQARFGGALPSCRDRESLLRSSRRRTWQQPEQTQTDRHPVICVSAAMADHYVEWLSLQTGHAYRLPRRIEWEALAGNVPLDCTANLRDEAAAAAWNAREALACSDGHAHAGPGGSLPAGPAGLYDLWGNVAEWLADCVASNCRERLAAGGSWFSSRTETGVRGFAAESGFTTIGFRVVRELPDAATQALPDQISTQQ